MFRLLADLRSVRSDMYVCGSDVACTTIRQDFRTEVLVLCILIFHFWVVAAVMLHHMLFVKS